MGFWPMKGHFLIYRLIKVLGLVTLALVTLANDNCKD